MAIVVSATTIGIGLTAVSATPVAEATLNPPHGNLSTIPIKTVATNVSGVRPNDCPTTASPEDMIAAGFAASATGPPVTPDQLSGHIRPDVRGHSATGKEPAS
ncbi:MAG: hypothetical protein OXC91_05515 [Rhodobacteraceae bacterium]|nr:hypothetical protein [Paracoccaceae bacterium]